MKLSKKDLRRALQSEEEALANDGLFPNRFGNAVQALKDGKLEIEGYVREDHIADDSKKVWTRFDPDDPKTFPPKDEYFDVFEKCKYEMRSVNKLNEFWWERFVERWGIQVKSRGYVIYWRPLPPPPQETEHI